MLLNVVVTLLALQVVHPLTHHPAAPPTVGTEIVGNDNRRAAGSLRGQVLELRLRAGRGAWRPEGASGRALVVEAFGEVGRPLSAPAPLIRVVEGTVIAAWISNELPHALRLFGFCDAGATCKPVEIPAGDTRELRFTAATAGTYTYWATTTGMPQQFRAADDTQLSGALIVDPRNGPVADDRVLVITEWTSLTRQQLRELAGLDDPNAAFLKLRPEAFFAINGSSWPHTERMRYRLGEPVRWRVINLSTQTHPMHLHGFYFAVNSLGDGSVDRPHAPDRTPHVVTQVLAPGATMTMTWMPERAGNWLFHCHVMTHVSPVLHVDGSAKADRPSHHHDPGFGMTGMVLGVTVEGPEAAAWSAGNSNPRRFTLVMEEQQGHYGDAPAMAFSLDGGDGVTRPATVPGPPLVLTRDEPVEITLINRLPEPTSVHWHGMELESYYDGVHGWGRTGEQVTPMIEPGGSFIVRFTPPRTGTFIYHTHLHDRRQLASGLYGALLVVDPGERVDTSTDHVLVLGRGGPQLESPLVINGSNAPQLVWKAGARHRLRMINITPDDIVVVTLQSSRGPVTWRPLTKDGAPVGGGGEPGMSVQTVAVGETYDFEIDTPPGRAVLWFEVRSVGGRWLAQGRIIVR